MSTNKTPNLQLHSWEADDPFSRAEFNENFAILDAESATLSHIALGAYRGNGTSGSANPNSITFDFEPKVVFIQSRSPAKYGAVCWLRGWTSSVTEEGEGASLVSLSWNGNTLSWYSSNTSSLGPGYQLNVNLATYRYCALG